MTDKRAELTLHVTDETGTSTREYVGLLFPVDKSKWGENSGRLFHTLVPQPEPPAATASALGSAGADLRFIVGSAPGSTPSNVSTSAVRRELVSGLAAGEYYAIAVDDVESERLRAPEFLEQLSRAATRVILSDGVSAEINLRRQRLMPSR